MSEKQREIKFRKYNDKINSTSFKVGHMHDIRFRAWDKGKMYYSESFHFWEDGSFTIGNGSGICSKEVVLMQFTGLLDKHGKEIYEGDILKCGTSKPLPVEYKHGGFLCAGTLIDNLDNVEVIGNIYENYPELLKETHV